MNAKEEVLEMLNIKKHELKERFEKLYDSAKKEESKFKIAKFKIANLFASQNKKINDLITAVENAIFDVPSEEEIRAEIKRRMLNPNQTLHFSRGINYILNYKKPEIDEKK